jgi:hypothetical protein
VRFAASMSAVRDQVDADIAINEYQVGGPFATTHQGANAGEQFGESERFAKIIIGPAVETPDPVVDLIPGSQEDDWGLAPGLTKATKQGQAILSTQQPIKQDQVPWAAF